jgi:hypothetical protein
LGGLLWGVGWFIALIWCFITPPTEKNTSSIASVADELEKLHLLKDKGVITEMEFELKKRELLQL